MKKKLFLHIGYGKAASTFLQTLFTTSSKINPIFLRNKNKKPLKIKEKINYIREKHNSDLINVISDEGLTSPFTEKNLDIYKKLFLTFNILKKHFDIKVFLFIRSQSTWFISRYSQNPLRLIDVNRNFFSYKQFTKIFDNKNYNYKIENFKKNVNYNLMYNFLIKEIGNKNLKFCIFEELIRNPQKIFLELENFFNKKNIFYKKSLNKLNKYHTFKIKSYYVPKIKFTKINYMVRKYGLFLSLKIYLFNSFFLPNINTNSENIKNFYKNSNIAFSKKIKKNLNKFNYF